jgi:PRONE (Plant-specific Rop nucleotide exchanger)
VNSQTASELELMKEKYFKILLGEDISGEKNDVYTANIITNVIINFLLVIFLRFCLLI